MANGSVQSHHHYHPQSIGTLASEDRVRHSDSDNTSQSSAGSSSRSWPEHDSSGGASVSGGFVPARIPALAASIGSRGRTNSLRSAGSAAPRRPLRGDEPRSELIEMIAGMHEEIGKLRRQLHRAAEHADPATRQEKLQAAQDRAAKTRFRHQMQQLKREKVQMQRQEEHANFKAAHELQMQEYEMARMRQKLENHDAQFSLAEEEQRAQLVTGAGNKATQLTRQL